MIESIQVEPRARHPIRMNMPRHSDNVVGIAIDLCAE